MENRNRAFKKRFYRPRNTPVEEGKEYNVTIEALGSKGDGIAKIQGFVVIVPGTKEEDSVKVKINAVRGSVAFAEKIE
ncbi:MAG: TRAM domain-containing protein [Candidatus Diapherotrites archaeon]|nr:TRAM domain-containing protein [Candidatus Diapherotrites archaeon]